jgi:hypothetical protein
MMWLSLIKSSEGLNWNFSNKSQNRIGFKFGFCTCLSILIITFSSNIWFQWKWYGWKAYKKWNKYVRNIFSIIRKFTMPKLPHNKRPQFWTNLESFSYLNWSFNLLLGQEDSRDDFYVIPRASRPLIVSINRPLSFKRMCLCLCLCLNLSLVLDRKFFLDAWQVEEETTMAGSYLSTTMSGWIRTKVLM